MNNKISLINTNAWPQILRYLMIVCIVAPVNFFSRFVFAVFMSFGWSVVVSNYVGMILVFLMSYKSVFGAKGFQCRMAFRFALVAHVGLAVVWLASLLMRYGCTAGIEAMGYTRELEFMTRLLPQAISAYGVEVIDGFCHGIGIVTGFFANFYGHKYFSFRRKENSL